MAQRPIEDAVLIAGPTASGKSALALEIARDTGGVVVNADSMQVYSVLRVVTARPSEADMAGVPHRLYGHVDPASAYSTGHWLRDVDALRDELDGRTAIFVGGTGLYFRGLLDGLSAMPEVPDALRRAWRERLAAEGAPALHGLLSERDPRAGHRLRPSDGQRILRALEVLDVSGRSILDWQGDRGTPLVASTARRIVIEPDREVLAARIASRIDRMGDEGAIAEVAALLARSIPASMPAMKAIGVRELAETQAGRVSLAQAKERMAAATRRYAKRQSTWFRTQLDAGWDRRG